MTDVNRSAFIRSVFEKNKDAKYKDVEAAWAESGNPANLVPTKSLFYLVKTNRKKKIRKTKATALALVSALQKTVAKSANSKKSQYLDIEKQLDRLCFMASELNDTRVMEEIRNSRRHASKKLLNL